MWELLKVLLHYLPAIFNGGEVRAVGTVEEVI
jgi:hypothetical protein